MNYKTKDQLIRFEKSIDDLWENGDLPFLMHLCGGNEEQLISIFSMIQDGDWIFSTHRSHYHFLLSGGKEEQLRELILKGKSMFIYSNRLNFFSSSIVAGSCSIAAGVAWSLKESGSDNKVWCFVGDGADDEGHFWESIHWVSGHELPCTFIIEDNDRSCDASKFQRRGDHDIRTYPSCVRVYKYKPTYPHCGTGSGKHVTFKLS